MKPKGLLIAVVLLAVLAGVIYWGNKKEATPGADTKAAKDTTTKLLSIPAGDFQEIRIKKLTNEVEVLKLVDGKWRITEPRPLPADVDAVVSMINTMGTLAADKTIDENATDLAPYGLSIPTLEITVTTKSGPQPALLIGDTTPTNSGAYAKMANSSKVYTIATFLKTSFDKTVNELRDKRLLTFEPEKVTRIQLQAKGASMEFGKNGQNEWNILKPRPLRADGAQVDTLIGKLRDAKMDALQADDAEDQKKNSAAFNGSAKVAVAIVSDAGGDQTIEIRRDKDKNYFAKSSVVEGYFKVASDIGDGLDKGLDDFRNKKVFDFGFSDPTKLEVKGVSYEKNGDKWLSGGKTMDSGSVQTLIDKLRDLSAAKFVEAGGGTPALDLVVTSNSGKKVEKVTVRKLADSYLAQRDGEPSIYQLDTKAFDDLQSAVNGVKEAAPAAPAKK